MAKVVRTVKNVTKGYSHVQVKVRNGTFEHLSDHRLMVNGSVLATSNDPWGPTGTEMDEIAKLTFNGYSILLPYLACRTDIQLALTISTR